MKVLDSTFLIDYLDGVESTRESLLEHNSEAFVFPALHMRRPFSERGTVRMATSRALAKISRGVRSTPSTSGQRIRRRRLLTKSVLRDRISLAWMH
ncbi:MAG: hypothetical protein ACOC8O_00355 [Natronomonas sp.]